MLPEEGSLNIIVGDPVGDANDLKQLDSNHSNEGSSATLRQVASTPVGGMKAVESSAVLVDHWDGLLPEDDEGITVVSKSNLVHSSHFKWSLLYAKLLVNLD